MKGQRVNDNKGRWRRWLWGRWRWALSSGKRNSKGKVKSVTKLINFIYIYIIKINRERLKEGGSWKKRPTNRLLFCIKACAQLWPRHMSVGQKPDITIFYFYFYFIYPLHPILSSRTPPAITLTDISPTITHPASPPFSIMAAPWIFILSSFCLINFLVFSEFDFTLHFERSNSNLISVSFINHCMIVLWLILIISYLIIYIHPYPSLVCLNLKCTILYILILFIYYLIN